MTPGWGLGPKVPQDENLGLDATGLKLLFRDAIVVETRTPKKLPSWFLILLKPKYWKQVTIYELTDLAPCHVPN